MVTEGNSLSGIQSGRAAKHALVGAGVAFLLVGGFLAFLLIAGHNMKPGAWLIPPLSIASFGGTLGGICYYLMGYFLRLEGWKKSIADVLFALVFIAGLWLSMVLGLATVGLWN